MKLKPNELTGAALDWAVGVVTEAGLCSFDGAHLRTTAGDVYSPSADWSQAGPLIDDHKISLEYARDNLWIATMWLGQGHAHNFCGAQGPTALIAAMRCLCRNKLGEEIEVPDELVVTN